MDIIDLLEEAEKAKNYSISSLSKFKVGAAILCQNGKVFSGCNIENFSLSLSICAERVALLKALSEGERDFKTIAVVSSGDDFCFPCGTCRQILWEFSSHIEVVVRNNKLAIKNIHIRELLPFPFNPFEVL